MVSADEIAILIEVVVKAAWTALILLSALNLTVRSVALPSNRLGAARPYRHIRVGIRLATRRQHLLGDNGIQHLWHQFFTQTANPLPLFERRRYDFAVK
jgi:hypothetical protein